MREVLVFDVDGTLTPPRSRMEDGMARIFRRIVATECVFLVTGSDIGKLQGQVDEDILAATAGVFVCSGNEFWRGGRLVRAMHHDFPAELVAHAQQLLEAAGYGLRTGRHVEERTGTLNISVVGRNANRLQRRDYHLHDMRTGERRAIAAAIEARFPDYEANCGGQISIDITPRGWNKGRLVREILERHPEACISFFGDNMGEGGNDLPLARALREHGDRHRLHAVSDHQETLAILKNRFLQSGARDAVA